MGGDVVMKIFVVGVFRYFINVAGFIGLYEDIL